MNFNQFNEILESTMVLNCYGVRGAYLYTPYATDFKKLCFSALENIILGAGYRFYEFPPVISTKLLEKQKSIFSFEKKVLYVSAFKDLNKKKRLYLRPDGVTQTSEMAKELVSSYKNLPFKLSEKGMIFRKPKKRLPFISPIGGTTIESYVFEASAEQSLANFYDTCNLIKNIFSIFHINALVVERPAGGNNPIADRMIGFDVPLPNGRTIQASSIYLHGTKYSKAFDIKYTDSHNRKEFVHMISWGVSERLFGIMLLLSADDEGLMIFPEFAPVQVTVIPVPKYTQDLKVKEFILGLVDELRKKGIRADSDMTKEFIIKKKLALRKKGIPIIVEVGGDEVEKQMINFIMRSGVERLSMGRAEFLDKINSLLDNFSQSVEAKMNIQFTSSILQVHDMHELADTSSNSILEFGFCQSEKCRHEIEAMAAGEILGADISNAQRPCIICGHEGKKSYFSRRL